MTNDSRTTSAARARKVGIAWYAREDYPSLREAMADAARLPASYDLWQLSAEQIAGEVARSGVAVVRVPLRPQEFLAWCARHALAPDGAARARFATEAAEQDPA